MNKVINNRLYDTETATAIASYDARHCPLYKVGFIATLYRKKTDEYFLYTKGGVFEDYPDQEKIEPQTLEEAKKWCAQHLSGDGYMKIFGPVEE